jgi:predicted ATPase
MVDLAAQGDGRYVSGEMDGSLEENRGAERASMLLAFRGQNVRSFRDPVELSMMATRLSEEGVPRPINWREEGHPISVLPAAGIFGANASGKSNLLRAMNDMRSLVLSSFRGVAPGGRLPTQPFLLGEDGGRAPSTYQVDLVLNGVRHEYGFVIDPGGVREEWARSYPRGRAVSLLQRVGENVALGSEERAKGRATQEILRPNALFLSTAAATNHPLFLALYEWFRRNLSYADVESRSIRRAITAEMLEGERRVQVLELLREADLGVTEVSQRAIDPEQKEKLQKVLEIFWDEEPARIELAEAEFKDFEVGLMHRAAGEAVELAEEDESRGTIVWFGLIGIVIEALREGSVLLADELEASLHPALVDVLVDLFQSQQSNPRRAQLIFNSHEVRLMGDSAERPLGRDQVFFTEKDPDGASRLHPLADLAPRREEAIAQRYLAGRYGGTPIFSRRRLRATAEPVGSPEE